jgi:hypothetical protein
MVLCGQPGTGKSQSPDLYPVQPLTGASIREKHLSEVPASATNLSSPGRTFRWRKRAYLFYHGQVYEKDDIHNLPTLFRNNRPQQVWALIDGDGMTNVPFRMNASIWPILATSPQPDRWKSWYNQFDAPIWGMPKWNFEELMAWYA